MEALEIIKIVGTALVSILVALGIAKAWLESLKKEVFEALDSASALVKEYKDATSEESNGGKKLTPDEIQAIIGKIGNFFAELMDVINVLKEKFKKK